MKKLLLLLFSLLISFNSYGEWEEIIENVDDDTFYIDKDTIKKHNGYVYWWDMGDFVEPYEPYAGFLLPVDGIMSEKSYKQGDCGVVSYKRLSVYYYKQPMGEGDGIDDIFSSNSEWVYPPPDSVNGFILDYICDYVD